MNNIIIVTIIILFVLVIPLLVGPFAFIGAITYKRQGITFIAEKLNMPSICMLVPPSDTGMMGIPSASPKLCYLDVGKTNKNLKACDMINVTSPAATDADIDLRNDCYLSVGLNLSAVAQKCINITNWENRAYCYAYFAVKLDDSSVCKNDGNNMVSAECYMKFVSQVPNPNLEICQDESSSVADKTFGVNDASYSGIWEDYCYYNIAVNTKNLSLCDKVINTKTKGYCQFDVKK